MDDSQPVDVATPEAAVQADPGARLSPAMELLASVRELLLRYLDEPRTTEEVAATFDVQKYQGLRWLKRLVANGAVEEVSCGNAGDAPKPGRA